MEIVKTGCDFNNLVMNKSLNRTRWIVIFFAFALSNGAALIVAAAYPDSTSKSRETTPVKVDLKLKDQVCAIPGRLLAMDSCSVLFGALSNSPFIHEKPKCYSLGDIERIKGKNGDLYYDSRTAQIRIPSFKKIRTAFDEQAPFLLKTDQHRTCQLRFQLRSGPALQLYPIRERTIPFYHNHLTELKHGTHIPALSTILESGIGIRFRFFPVYRPT
jgi:hypothetical protein